MSMVFCSSLMLEKSSNHSSSTRDLKIYLAFVMNKTPYSHFLLTVFTHDLLLSRSGKTSNFSPGKSRQLLIVLLI